MKTFRWIIAWLALWATTSFAAFVAVLETGADGSAKEEVSLTDRQFLTNVLREQAVKELPAIQNYTIMTRENILQMLPPGKAIEDCEGSCLVETGKNIAADFICQARVGRFGNSFTLSAELYETAGNKLIASFNGRGQNVEELLDIIKQNSSAFFRSVKNNSTFVGVGGIGDFKDNSNYTYASKQKFFVEIISNPEGAIPTLDGKAIPKCLNTPCKVQVEEGQHRFVATKEHYTDDEVVVDIKGENQKVSFTLSPNFGFLEINPILAGKIANKGRLRVEVDGSIVNEQKVMLDQGIHDVRVSHPCYDPVEFKVSIVKNKTEVFNKEMVRGKGGLELNAKLDGVPKAVNVHFDGTLVGKTPYAGEVPLCTEVTLRGRGVEEKVNVELKWHEVVQVTHNLSEGSEAAVVPETVFQAQTNYVDDVYISKPSTRESRRHKMTDVSANVEETKSESSTSYGPHFKKSVAAAVVGVVCTSVGVYMTNSSNKKTANFGKAIFGSGIALTVVGTLGAILNVSF